MNNYTVYLHRNKSNGKVYIGITNRPVEKRWANGKAYSHCRRFNNAIKKYGWDGFEHTIVKDSLCKEEALSLEQSLIEHYQSCDVNKGYNLTSGEACPYKKRKGKKVRKCDSNGQVIAIYDSIIEAAVSNNINQSNIVKACRGKLNAVGGYKWEYAANSV